MATSLAKQTLLNVTHYCQSTVYIHRSKNTTLNNPMVCIFHSGITSWSSLNIVVVIVSLFLIIKKPKPYFAIDLSMDGSQMFARPHCSTHIPIKWSIPSQCQALTIVVVLCLHGIYAGFAFISNNAPVEQSKTPSFSVTYLDELSFFVCNLWKKTPCTLSSVVWFFFPGAEFEHWTQC